MLLSKDQILACSDLRSEVVSMPEWGGEIKIKAMSVEDQIEFEKLNKKCKDASEIVCNTLLFCCVNENGDRLFDEADIKLLQKKSFRSVEKLFRACLALNSLDPGALEKEAKNS